MARKISLKYGNRPGGVRLVINDNDVGKILHEMENVSGAKRKFQMIRTKIEAAAKMELAGSDRHGNIRRTIKMEAGKRNIAMGNYYFTWTISGGGEARSLVGSMGPGLYTKKNGETVMRDMLFFHVRKNPLRSAAYFVHEGRPMIVAGMKKAKYLWMPAPGYHMGTLPPAFMAFPGGRRGFVRSFDSAAAVAPNPFLERAATKVLGRL